MGKPTHKGIVDSIAASKKSFTVKPESIEALNGDVFEAELAHEGHRVTNSAWCKEEKRPLPNKGDAIFFRLDPVKGGLRIVGATSVDPREQAVPALATSAAPNASVEINFGACKGDNTVERFPNSHANQAPVDEVLTLSWRDILVPIWRSIRGMFARGLKARATARS